MKNSFYASNQCFCFVIVFFFVLWCSTCQLKQCLRKYSNILFIYSASGISYSLDYYCFMFVWFCLLLLYIVHYTVTFNHVFPYSVLPRESLLGSVLLIILQIFTLATKPGYGVNNTNNYLFAGNPPPSLPYCRVKISRILIASYN